MSVKKVDFPKVLNMTTCGAVEQRVDEQVIAFVFVVKKTTN